MKTPRSGGNAVYLNAVPMHGYPGAQCFGDFKR